MDGGKMPPFRWRRQSAEDIAREQRMVEEYLQSLERQAITEQRADPVPADEPAPIALPAEPVLTEAMARAASEHQLRLIAEHAQAAERARELARAETRRRRRLAVMLLAIDD
jgi:hypothetical protein